MRRSPLRRGLPHNNQVQELGIAYHIGGHGAQFLQGASGGAGHNQGVKAPLPGVVDNFRAGAAPQQFGADCPAGQQGGEGFQLLGGLAGHPVPGELAVDVHLVGQDHQKGNLGVLGAVGLLDHVDGAQAAGTSVNGQEHVFHGIRPPIQMGGNHGGKGERRWPFPFCGQMTDDVIRLREEIAEQIKCLEDMKKLAEIYGYDISRPATNAKEAVQWLYFGYLAAIKTQNGAAMSVGRVSTFLDIYIKRDMDKGILTEQEAQELIDHFTMKLRMVKFARIPSYNQLFSGDPVWATLDVAGTGVDGRSMVTKTDFRFLHTLENMGPAPEPNLTVFYSSKLPQTFKDYAARISIETSSIQYENDDAMKPVWGDDYAICCCVSATQTGKEMQFFGARANLAKCLLYAINGGVDEKSGEQVGPNYAPITAEYLDYDEVMAKYDKMMDWLVDIYVNTLNLIQYMHDKYYYEAAELALMDTDLKRTFATGIAGFSHVIDSLSAIKYAKVKVVRDESGLAKDFEIEGEFPKYGNDDDRADEIGVWLLKTFMDKLKKHHTYRDSEPTTSILTITSNVVYGKATGAMPDGRKAGEPLSPGANPSYGAEQNGLLASLNSLTKLPYEWALDGISNTQTINPGALGNNEGERIDNLVNVMDGYFDQGAHHLNVNVFGKEKLIDAMEHPEKEEYANFTIRVSGYAVKFIDLTREQQLDVISRTCHERM